MPDEGTGRAKEEEMIRPGEESAPAGGGQTALNIARYADVYQMCLGQARRIADDQGTVPRDDTLQITEAIFYRFFADQVELQSKANVTEKLGPLIEAGRAWLDRQGFLR